MTWSSLRLYDKFMASTLGPWRSEDFALVLSFLGCFEVFEVEGLVS